jgi:hypothetical protein
MIKNEGRKTYVDIILEDETAGLEFGNLFWRIGTFEGVAIVVVFALHSSPCKEKRQAKGVKGHDNDKKR